MIVVRDLVHSRSGTTALDGVSLRIDDGEFLALVGPNGSGKTTLVRHLNGLLEPDEGIVSIDGVAVPENPVAARTSVGMVFQNPRDCFVAATVEADVAFGPENLGLDRAEIDRRVTAALEAVGMADQRRRRIDHLSGGQQARVAIAGALAMEPSHLVLDEPFSGLDWSSRRAILERIDALSDGGTSVVVVTHDLQGLWERVDRIVALSAGEVAFDGPTETAGGRLESLGVRPC